MLGECSDALNLDNLRRFAPFLKRSMVDTLVETITKARESVEHAGIIQQAGGVFEGIKNMMSEAIKSVSQPAQSTSEAEECSCEAEAYETAPETADTEEPITDIKSGVKPEEVKADPAERRVVSSELKDKVARAALNAGSWAWLKAHISEVGDPQLILDIATAASQDDELFDLFKAASGMLSEGWSKALIAELLNLKLYDKLILCGCTDTATANAVVAAACEDIDTIPNAIDAVKAFAKLASKEKLDELVDKAVAEGKWDLIEVLTPAM